MEMVTISINGKSISVPKDYTILQAARSAGIDIPTLCYLKDINEIGACRMCLVEVKGARTLVTACVYPVNEGMEVFTQTERVRKARQAVLELMLSNHNKKCLTCARNRNCELQTLAEELNVTELPYEGAQTPSTIDDVSPSIVRDNSKCILCRRCVAVCNKIQTVGVIGANNRGFASEIGCAFEKKLNATSCIACGQCINVCPTGALHEKDDTAKVMAAIQDPDKYVIVGTAPSVRVALGEEFGYPIGTDSEGKMVAAIRRLGVDKVFDVNMAADMTIMEEGTELLGRLQDKTAALPMITSCSPGWIRFVEFYYPELIPHLSSCKSPQQMFGAIMKTYYAEKFNIDPKKIYVVSIMPCVAKKTEILRDDEAAAGVPDVDVVLTTRELARLIKAKSIDFAALPNEEFDNPIGQGTTAGLIFGATGGVMEAALRTVADILTGENLEKIDYKAVRGTAGIKEAKVKIAGKEIKVCVAHTMANARKILDDIKAGKCDYHFIEIMTCPGGCVNGGGQPIVPSYISNNVDVKALRAKAIYNMDKKGTIRKSHENPVVKTLYEEYFDKPNSHKAHHILHTTYHKRDKY